MSIATLLEMARSDFPDRIIIGGPDPFTLARLDDLATAGARMLQEAHARSVAFIGVNGPWWPLVFFAAAKAGIQVAPVSYRLPTDQLVALVKRLERPIVVADARYVAALAASGLAVRQTDEWVRAASTTAARGHTDDLLAPDSEQPAVVLFTSGTTAAPKGVVLRHSHLFNYVIQTVEFGHAAAQDAALVSVPPYHVAGVGTILTNVYAGRRLVYLENFTPEGWLTLVRDEGVTQAMVVPTMLARIVDYLADHPANTPSLQSIAYGGAAMPRPVLERALRAFPEVGFTNGYGLTETSSTIAVLSPQDHREAMTSSDPTVRNRLNSVGRVVPGVQVRICAEDGRDAVPGSAGELHVRGDQVSGEYLDQDRAVDGTGWFNTRDRACIANDGYLYVLGRMDDTIIRGGENIAPAEIETVLLGHPLVRDVGVVGVPDEEWGEIIVAVLVARAGTTLTEDAARTWVRDRLGSSRTPDRVVFRDELPYSPIGKLLRRDLRADLLRHLFVREEW